MSYKSPRFSEKDDYFFVDGLKNVLLIMTQPKARILPFLSRYFLEISASQNHKGDENLKKEFSKLQ